MEKKYTAREAAIAVLNKTEELLKSWHSKKSMKKAEDAGKAPAPAGDFKGVEKQKESLSQKQSEKLSKPMRPLKAFLAKIESKRASK